MSEHSTDYADEVHTIVNSFDYELCDECGFDLDHHIIAPDVLGHAHVHCMRPADEVAADIVVNNPAMLADTLANTEALNQ